MHIPDGTLRAKLDGELSEAETLAAETHLSECARCRERAQEIAARARRTSGLLAELSPPEESPETEPAWMRLQEHLGTERKRPVWTRLWQWQPATAFGAVAAAMALTLVVSPPARAVAQRFLGLLRIHNVVVVPLERDFIAEGKGKMIGQLLSESVTVTKQEAARQAASRDDASRLAGFAVRLPAARPDTPRLTVQGAHGFYFTASTKRFETLAGVLGRPDIALPDGLDGARVVVDIPRAVTAAYGECPESHAAPPRSPGQYGNCVVFTQVPAPTVVTLPELDLARIAAVGLELTGMTPEQAQSFSRAVDWTSTLAIPLPRYAARYENVTVDGVAGVLITSDGMGHRPAGWSLIWIKGGIVYSLSGFGSSSAALPAAGSIG